jgi:hypothetical protein
MIRTGEIRKGNGQIQFSLAVLETTRLRPKLKVDNADPALSFSRNGINLSCSPLLIGSLSALCTIGLLLWVIIQLWLFE